MSANNTLPKTGSPTKAEKKEALIKSLAEMVFDPDIALSKIDNRTEAEKEEEFLNRLIDMAFDMDTYNMRSKIDNRTESEKQDGFLNCLTELLSVCTPRANSMFAKAIRTKTSPLA